MAWGYWSSLPAGGLPAIWLVKLRQMGEVLKVLPQYGGPRPKECGVGDHSPCSPLCSVVACDSEFL